MTGFLQGNRLKICCSFHLFPGRSGVWCAEAASLLRFLHIHTPALGRRNLIIQPEKSAVSNRFPGEINRREDRFQFLYRQFWCRVSWIQNG